MPPSAEDEKNERLTYDLEYHGTDGARHIVYWQYGVEHDDLSVGPLTLGFCNTRTGWDVSLQDVRPFLYLFTVVGQLER